MSNHDVRFKIPERRLEKADIEVKVRRNGRAFGRFRISEGSLVWIPADKSSGYKLKWDKFDELAQEHGKKGYK